MIPSCLASISDSCQLNDENSFFHNFNRFKSVIACDVCKPGYFWSSETGCNKCFCSGVSNECHAGSFHLEEIDADLNKVKGFVDWPNRPVGPLRWRFNSGFEYEFNKADASGGFIWEFPFPFYGNGARSYGGSLEFVQMIKLIRGGHISDESITTRIISSEVNISIVATPIMIGGPPVVGPFSLIFKVPLTERNAYIDGDRSRPATKADVMRALLSANKILVVSGPEANKKSIFIYFVKQRVAVDLAIPSGLPKTDTIEVCDCPEGYSGDSCESCTGRLCKPCKNPEPCEEQCNDNGICLGCPQCLECTSPYHRNINNKMVSVFGACESGHPK